MARLLLMVLFFGIGSEIIEAQVLKPAPIEASSPREEIRKKIFGAKISQRACEVIAKDPGADQLTVDPELQKVVKTVIESIRSKDEKTLRDLFNTRIKVKSGHVLGALQGLNKITGANASVSNYRVAALNSPDGSAEAIECEDTGVLMHPLYGYPLSVGLWLQANGEEEVARIFVALVPNAKSWTIGAWHVQQWTHAGKDFAMWYELAQTESQKGRKAGAFIAADLAAKLLDGGGFLVFPVKVDADTFRDQQMSKDAWAKAIAATFPEDKVVHTATLFVREGAGVLVRFEIPAEMSANAIKDHCTSRLNLALKADWTSVISGIRCSYVLPREDPLREGVFGGMFLNKDISKPKI